MRFTPTNDSDLYDAEILAIANGKRNITKGVPLQNIKSSLKDMIEVDSDSAQGIVMGVFGDEF